MLKPFSDHYGAVSSAADRLRADSSIAVSRSDCDVKRWADSRIIILILYRDKSPRGVIVESITILRKEQRNTI